MTAVYGLQRTATLPGNVVLSEAARNAEAVFETSTIAEIREVCTLGCTIRRIRSNAPTFFHNEEGLLSL